MTLAVETVASGLEHPWGMALMPDGGTLVTERPGRLRIVAADGSVSEPVAGLPEVFASGQGGLAGRGGLAGFRDGPDDLLDLRQADGRRAVGHRGGARHGWPRMAASVTEVEDIFVQAPASPTDKHYGSRIVLDGAGHAFVTMGEHFTPRERAFSQDLGKTYGKVVRVNVDGSVPEDNPFAGESDAVPTIYSYGHRNVQAAALDGQGRLWTVEHGPKGGDEVNLEQPGGNYGWPVISYGENYDGSPVGDGIAAQEGMVQPRYYWDPVIAPSGMAFYDGAMFADWEGDALIGAMNPGGLVRLEIDGDRVTGEERLLTDQGRIRDVEIAPDGAVLTLVDAKDGRLLRLTPQEPLVD